MQYTDKVYGAQEIDDALIIGLINTKEMQRLKGIDQYGIVDIGKPKPRTSRFDHSLGVYFLLRRFNASRLEQVAGLLHDTGHTAFSHAIDFVYKNELHEMHETFSGGYLEKSEIAELLEKNSIDMNTILDKSRFRILDIDLPDLCADRLDYTFRDAVVFGISSISGVTKLLDSVVLHDSELIMKDAPSARAITDIFFGLNEKFYCALQHTALHQILANALKLALDKGIISKSDFYLTDNELLKKIAAGKDKQIGNLLDVLKNPKRIAIGTEAEHTFHTKPKVRFIDPKFLSDGRIKRLSEVDSKFKARINSFKKRIEDGFYIKILGK